MPLSQDLARHFFVPHDPTANEAANHVDNHVRTSFYVDCRLYRVGVDEAEQHRKEVGFELPELGEQPATRENYKEDWAADAEEATSFVQNCEQVQGLFQKKVMKLVPTDNLVFNPLDPVPKVVNIKALWDQYIFMQPTDKTWVMAKPGADAPGAVWIMHAITKTWWKCFIELTGPKSKPEQMMKCMPYISKGKGNICGFRVCNQDRATYKTVCIKKQAASLSQALTGGLFGNKCLYVGHAGELQPRDIAGKPVDYAVFILQSPAPLLVPPVFKQGQSPLPPRRAKLRPAPRPAATRRSHDGWSFLSHAAS